MKTKVDEALVRDAAALSFRFACADCVHHAREDDRCAHGYPARVRRLLVVGEEVELCKEFECA